MRGQEESPLGIDISRSMKEKWKGGRTGTNRAAVSGWMEEWEEREGDLRIFSQVDLEHGG